MDAGVDIVTNSRRLGHSKPDITLRVDAHLFRKDDGKAAAAINAALRSRVWDNRRAIAVSSSVQGVPLMTAPPFRR
jgi:hypothetical protein